MDLASRWRSGRSLYSLILRQTFRFQALIIVAGFLLPVLAVVPLELQKRIIDEAIPAADLGLVGWLALLYIGAVALRSGLKFAVVFLRGWIAEIVSRVLRTALVNVQRHRDPAGARGALGAVTSVLTAEVDPLGEFAAEAINTPLIQGGTLLGVIGFMVYTEPSLAAIGVGALVLEAIVTPILQHRINLLTRKRIKTLRHAGADIIAAAEPSQHRLFVDTLRDVRRTYRLRIRMNALKAALKVGRNLIDHLADIAVLGFGAAMVVRGEMELGVIVAFLSGLRELRGPWGELVSFYRRLADARVKYWLVRSALEGGAAVAALEPRSVRPGEGSDAAGRAQAADRAAG